MYRFYGTILFQNYIQVGSVRTKKQSSLKQDNTISLNAATTINLFEDLDYDLKSIRDGQKVKPIYLTKLPKDLNSLGNTKIKRELNNVIWIYFSMVTTSR